MPKFNVHIYREMRLVFPGIEAETHEDAAAIASLKETGEAESVEEENTLDRSALVDVVGDAEYKESRFIDFKPELQEKMFSELLDALKVAEGAIDAIMSHGRQSTLAPIHTHISEVIKKAEKISN